MLNLCVSRPCTEMFDTSRSEIVNSEYMKHKETFIHALDYTEAGLPYISVAWVHASGRDNILCCTLMATIFGE